MAGGSKKKRASKKKRSTRDVTAELTDDVLVDIISRVPVKSVCRCKAVSRRWRGLISHPEHRKKLSQTLAGFFYESNSMSRFPKSARHFTNVSRKDVPFIDPALSFLPKYKSINIVDSCNGLLLCRCWKLTDPETMDCVVCNPASEQWMLVPDSGWSSKVSVTRLAFDPAVSSYFHVFEFIRDDVWFVDDDDAVGKIAVVAVYSSENGVWSLNTNDDCGLDDIDIVFDMPIHSRSVFFNGILHLPTYFSLVLAIDLEGNVLRCIYVPDPAEHDSMDELAGDIFGSQGHLYFADSNGSDESQGYELSVWVLEDYSSGNWTLKHNFNARQLLGANYYSQIGHNFQFISIHPEHDTLFMVCGIERSLMAYDMVHKKRYFIKRLGRDYSAAYIPYVPLLSEELACGMCMQTSGMDLSKRGPSIRRKLEFEVSIRRGTVRY